MTATTNTRERSAKKTEKSTGRKEHAHAINRILDRKTRQTVGWLYEWNTGQVGIMWKDKPCKDVIYA